MKSPRELTPNSIEFLSGAYRKKSLKPNPCLTATRIKARVCKIEAKDYSEEKDMANLG
jgi:hypothetical protein